MHWSDGHLWKSWIEVANLPIEFHYKYAVQELSTLSIKRWEGGPNRIFDLTQIEDHLCSPENAYSVHTSSAYKFELNGNQYMYLREKEHLVIIL